MKFNKALKKMLIRIDLKDVYNKINFYLVNKNIVSDFTFVAPSLTERDKEEKCYRNNFILVIENG